MSIGRARNIADLRLLAQKRLPRMVFDYIDGAADDEITLRRNVERFRDYELLYNVLVDVSAIDTSTTLMGQQMKQPFFISPTASSRLFSPKGGERCVARAAHKAGVVYSISTLGSTSIEDVGQETSGPKFFQVYVWKDRGLVKEILQRVKAAGFKGLILTVDLPIAGNRERDPKNDFTIPPKVTPRTASQALARPGYMLDMITSPRINAANFGHLNMHGGGLMDFVNQQFDRTVAWNDAEWIRDEWGGPFALKGICTAADADRSAAMGAVPWISNHGGRQLDTCPPTIDLLPAIAAAVKGRTDIVFDGGVRRGTDVIKAIALGATAVALGRAYLWGLAAGGEEGVTRALTIMEQEVARAMALLGRTKISDLTAEMVRLPQR